MTYDETFFRRFLEVFASAPPEASERARPISKQRIVSSVRSQIDQWRRQGHTLESIAARFAALGVAMPVATLRTCLRRCPKEKPRPARMQRPPRGLKNNPKPSATSALDAMGSKLLTTRSHAPQTSPQKDVRELTGTLSATPGVNEISPPDVADERARPIAHRDDDRHTLGTVRAERPGTTRSSFPVPRRLSKEDL